MTKWARVDEQNVIQEIIDFDPTDRFHPDLIWVEVPEDWETHIHVDWTITSTGEVTVNDLNQFRNYLKQLVSARRWQAQIAGIVVFGNKFLSDPNNLSIIANAVQGGSMYEQMTGAPGSFSANWKSESGFVSLNLQQLATIGLFGMQYTQLTFTREGEITTLIDAATTAEDARDAYEDNVEIGWPDNTMPNPVPPEEPEPEE